MSLTVTCVDRAEQTPVRTPTARTDGERTCRVSILVSRTPHTHRETDLRAAPVTPLSRAGLGIIGDRVGSRRRPLVNSPTQIAQFLAEIRG